MLEVPIMLVLVVDNVCSFARLVPVQYKWRGNARLMHDGHVAIRWICHVNLSVYDWVTLLSSSCTRGWLFYC